MIESLRIEPGAAARISERDPRDALGLVDKPTAKARLQALTARLFELQAMLYAEGTRSLLLVLQGLDAAGKDGVIKAVFRGVNPQGCQVVSFKAPTTVELSHDYLWRVHSRLPPRGSLGIFNRSHYEDIVAVRVWRLRPEEVWRRRSSHVVEWERMLADEGTSIVKVFLNVSREEQRRRLQERIDDPRKRWKFQLDDLEARQRFDDFVAAYEETLTATSTEWAPWHVVPADRNWVKSAAVAELLVHALERMDPRYPPAEPGIEGLVVE